MWDFADPFCWLDVFTIEFLTLCAFNECFRWNLDSKKSVKGGMGLDVWQFGEQDKHLTETNC